MAFWKKKHLFLHSLHHMRLRQLPLPMDVIGVDDVSNSVSKSVAVNLLKGTRGTSRFSDVTTLAIGYMFIFSLGFVHLGLITLIAMLEVNHLSLEGFMGFLHLQGLFFLFAMAHLTLKVLHVLCFKNKEAHRAAREIRRQRNLVA